MIACPVCGFRNLDANVLARLITRRENTFHSETVSLCRFVPLRGTEGWDPKR